MLGLELGLSQSRRPISWWPSGATMAADFTRHQAIINGTAIAPKSLLNTVRDSTKYAAHPDGVLQLFQANEPAITGKGLLVWEGVSNLALWSEDFTQSPWAGANITLTPGASDGPRGPGTMTKQASTASGGTVFSQSRPATATTHTFSVVAQKGSGASQYNKFGVWNGTANAWAALASLNYDTGTFTATTGTGRAVDLGNNTYRIEVASIPVNIGDVLTFYPGMTGVVTAPGDHNFIDMAQFETGTQAGPYTPATDVSLPSKADNITLAQSGILPFSGFNPNEGTFLIAWSDVDEITGAEAPYIFEISDGSLNNRWFLQITDLSFWLRLKSQVSGIVTDGPTYTSSPGPLSNGTHKIAISYNAMTGRLAMSVDGSAVTATNLPMATGITQFRLGSSLAGQHLNGNINSLAYIPNAMADALLPAQSASQ